ncbi:anaerobic ribonucleoside-triphosphate reductase [uncultured Clostridium sp.]|uniref:anaerobic ribonucleoside-triphosphate reductase n=1 Tax=uncultured Clostridium sp. TaxID=59620 RepID=UPI0032179505
MIKVIKKDGTLADFDKNKIAMAICKSAERVMINLSEDDIKFVCDNIYFELNEINNKNEISVDALHNMVENALDNVNHSVATSYREYRNYKKDFIGMLDEVYQKSQKIMYLGDKDNSNTDSSLVTTKRSLVYGELNKELYNKFFLTQEERQACRDGYIYIHDKSARRDTMNCCLYDTKSVMTGGFEMGNLWYNEPNSIDTACDVLGDIIMMSASMQYGGWSTRVDDLLAPYVEKSYEKYKEELLDFGHEINGTWNLKYIEDLALNKAQRDLEQGIQGLEYKLNSVASSRGDYPFTTFAIGLSKDRFGKMVSEAVLKVRMNGQGKKNSKKPVLFPKIIFLYDKNLHGTGKELEYLFDLGISCSSKAMYPDYLSLTGEGYVSDMYKKYGVVIYPMGQLLVA